MKKALLILLILSITSISSAQLCTTKSGYPAAMSESDFDRAISCIVSRDKIALARLLQSGRVIMLRSGIKVYPQDYKFFKGRVQVRPQGKNVLFWTNIEAIDCK